MSEFLIGVGVLLLIALLLIILPWIVRNRRAQQDELTNTRLIKLRLSELSTEQEQGLLSNHDRIQSEQELQLALLEEVNHGKPKASQTHWVMILGLLIAIAVVSAVYYQVNQLKQINHWQDAVSQLSALGKNINSGQNIEAKQLQDFALGLRTRLHQEPDDAIGWMLLGRVWGALNQPNTAKEAFEKSLAINPDSIATLMSYSQALVLLGGESELQQAVRVLKRVLELEPDNINAVGTLALVSTELGDKATALTNWLKLQKSLPAGDANYVAVQEKINELQNDGQKLSNDPSFENTAKEIGLKVSITVDIDDALKAKLPEQGMLFVFAQDPTGQVRFPAAVIKLPLGQFPLTVELSDDNAMMPSYTLSNLTTAKLVARVSLDGDVAQASGELQGEIIVDLNADNSLNVENILINKEVK